MKEALDERYPLADLALANHTAAAHGLRRVRGRTRGDEDLHEDIRGYPGTHDLYGISGDTRLI
jgi:hypothetical protein